MLQKFGITELLVILRVNIAHIVPGGTGAAGHGRGLPDTVDAVAVILLPLGGILQRSLAVSSLVVLQLRQDQRQLLIGEEHSLAVVGVHAGNRLAPVALAGKNPLPEVVVVLPPGNPRLFQLAGNGLLGLLHGQTGELLGVHKSAALAQVILLLKGALGHIPALNDLDHGNIVYLGILKVTLIVAWHRHHRTGSVIGQNEVTDEHRNFLTVHRIDGINTLKPAAGLALVQLRAVHVALFQGFLDVSANLFLVLHPVHQRLHDLSVGSQDHEGDAVDGFDTGSIDGELTAAH